VTARPPFVEADLRDLHAALAALERIAFRHQGEAEHPPFDAVRDAQVAIRTALGQAE
jgi:hypothetical protein